MKYIRKALIDRIFNLPDQDFEALALDIFQYQSQHNKIYKAYLNHLKCDLANITRVAQIPCLPIQFFKSHKVQTGDWKPIMTFESSGTTGAATSKHFVRELDIYKQLAIKAFNDVYGEVNQWCFLALLPHYLERKSSSLIQMVKMFQDASIYDQSDFYLDNREELITQIRSNQKEKIPTILIGVS